MTSASTAIVLYTKHLGFNKITKILNKKQHVHIRHQYNLQSNVPPCHLARAQQLRISLKFKPNVCKKIKFQNEGLSV